MRLYGRTVPIHSTPPPRARVAYTKRRDLTSSSTFLHDASMARTTAYHVLADADEIPMLNTAAETLHFDKPSVAMRELMLAVAGDQRATERVHPFLRDFRARLAELDRSET